MKCNSCSSAIDTPSFISDSNVSITSLCELKNGKTKKWVCKKCGHILGEPFSNNEEYYSSEYKILINSSDEDQIYDTVKGEIIYRTDHQIRTLLSKVEISKGLRLLDYGCAKASTPRSLLKEKPDINLHLFDVSDMYVEYWKEFIPEEKFSINVIPPQWYNSFDIVTSFFALEHIPDISKALKDIYKLLNHKGLFYGIVPYVFDNIADFVVRDHVNHFTIKSLSNVLIECGFNIKFLESTLHRGALVFCVEKNSNKTSFSPPSNEYSNALDLAQYWTNIDRSILEIEKKWSDKPTAIYGSGFYGTYVAKTLRNLNFVTCFIDKNPYQHDKNLFYLQVKPLDQIPKEVDRIYLAVNPIIASKVSDELQQTLNRTFEIFTLRRFSNVTF